MPTFIERLTRKKIVDFGESELRRALTFVDLTFLGVGSTIGVGFYVLVGDVAKNIAGPAVVISFLIAGIASVFAGLCYAEFGARVPKAGSAYIYSYVCVGECVGFIIGWNLALEYIIGAASVSRGFSGYIDFLANKSISNAFRDAMPINTPFLSDYPDFLSFGLIIFVTVLLVVGIKESTLFNNVFSTINLVVVVYVIIAASTKVELHNWQLSVYETHNKCSDTSQENITNVWGVGGFAPYGFSGIMQGAATCFFGFVGFDCIATTGEEAINPSRNIPLAISVSLLVIFLAYFFMATTVTLALPYCQQDVDAALVSFFAAQEMPISEWIVSIGALFGFSACLIGVLIPLPRIIYAMANDGIIFRYLAKINKRFKTPVIATLLTGLLSGVLAMIFDLESLVDMMSIGTLMAYTIVAVSVMLLRYIPDKDEESGSLAPNSKDTRARSGTVQSYRTKDIMRQLFNLDRLTEPTELSGSIATYGTLVFTIIVSILCLLLVTLADELSSADVGTIVGVCIMFVLNIINVIILAMQPESNKSLTFKVPLVPWIPAFSAFVNVYLMFNLKPDTWIRFAVWMGVGFPIYFFYGLSHSTEELRAKGHLHGIDNPNAVGNDNNKRQFIIPTINVQVPTPMNSTPNTPMMNHPAKKKPLPVSPLALEMVVSEDQGNTKEEDMKIVVEENQTTESNVDNKTTKNISNAKSKIDESTADEVDIQKVLASLDMIVNESPSSAKPKEYPEGRNDHKILQDDENLRQANVQSRKLPLIPNGGEGSKLDDQTNSVFGNGSFSSASSSSINPVDLRHAILSHNILKKVDSGEYPFIDNEETKDDPPYETIDTVKVQMAEIPAQSKEERTKMSVPLMSEILKTVPKANAIDDQEPTTVPSAPNDKEGKKRPIPLDLTDNTLSDSLHSSLQGSASAPQMSSSSSSPTKPLPPSPFSDRSSVPNTPSSRRHPFKILKRNSSFDGIPPSPLDSPNARRVDKFFIIPVKEPDLSDSGSSSLQPSPSPTIHSHLPDGESVDPLMLALKKKFKIYESEKNSNEDNPKINKMFYVGNEDSMEDVNTSSDLPSPTNVSHMRELKRMTNKDHLYLGEGLDTIRERGESKINPEDIHSVSNIHQHSPLGAHNSHNQDANGEQAGQSYYPQTSVESQNEKTDVPQTDTQATAMMQSEKSNNINSVISTLQTQVPSNGGEEKATVEEKHPDTQFTEAVESNNNIKKLKALFGS